MLRFAALLAVLGIAMIPGWRTSRSGILATGVADKEGVFTYRGELPPSASVEGCEPLAVEVILDLQRLHLTIDVEGSFDADTVQFQGKWYDERIPDHGGPRQVGRGTVQGAMLGMQVDLAEGRVNGQPGSFTLSRGPTLERCRSQGRTWAQLVLTFDSGGCPYRLGVRVDHLRTRRPVVFVFLEEPANG